MKRVRVVGGGLTGILAAFEAARLGAEVSLEERFEALGGVARPRVAHGLELRDGCIYFGPPGEPVRTALEAEGLAFDEVPNRMASLGPGEAAVRGFAGPAMMSGAAADPSGPAARAPQDEVEKPRERNGSPHAEVLAAGEPRSTQGHLLLQGEKDTLADRLTLYPVGIANALRRYVEWHVGVPPERLAAEAAIPLAINRVWPRDMPAEALAARKRADPVWDELYGLPSGLWGRTANLTASLPRGGFTRLFDDCGRALAARGVRVETGALVSPRQALAQAVDQDELLVWAASPTPLFKVAGIKPPPMVRKSFATYVFRATFAGELPFYLQNFTAEGVVFRLYAYASGGEALVAAECVAEAPDSDLRAEIARLMSGFPEEGLRLGAMLSLSVQPRWIYHSPQTLAALGDLRARLADMTGGRFIAGAWEPYAKAAKLAEVNAAVAAALSAAPLAMSA